MKAIKSTNIVKQLAMVSILVTSLFLVPADAQKSQVTKAEQTWQPFFDKFLLAIKKRDREALRQMMSPDIFFSGGGGDDNHDDDMRDDAFKFWDETRAWKRIEKSLREGAVPMAHWWNDGKPHKYPSRVAPPIANRKGNRNYSYFAIFEFHKDGQWHCIALTECCD